jgi:hypothetical protein
MSGIIELWRKGRDGQQPVRFAVGAQPMLSNGTAVDDAPIVSSITYRELKTLGKNRFEEAMFCINFTESFVQRLIPASEITEVAYETIAADAAATPALKDN